MPRPELSLSWLQQNVLKQLGIDSWYLNKPLIALSPAQKRRRQSISQFTDSLIGKSQTKPMPPKDIDIKPPYVSQVRKPTSVTETQTKTAGPPTVKLEPDKPPAPAITSDISFNLSGINPGWQAIDEQLSAIESSTIIAAQGSKTADCLVVICPSSQGQTLLNSDEHHLLKDILSAIDLGIENTYISPVIKQSSQSDLDPDQNTLKRFRPILLAEILELKPKHILCFGQDAMQQLLQTNALLSIVMPMSLTLSVNSQHDKTVSAPLLCLPALNYLLAIPAEKSLVWQRLKKHTQ